MFGRKSQRIRDLERLVRVRTSEREEARGDYKALHADLRSVLGTDLDTIGHLQQRLNRALRACARYRADEAALARHLARVQNSYDHTVGLDHPDIDAGAGWQERRPDKAKGIVL